jgi:hypothetical protein
VRGDTALTARLLLRGTGLAGMTATLGGALAVIAATRPWYLAVADLSMLGEQQHRTVASLPGMPTTVWGWLAVAFGLAVVVLGTNVALDRPPPYARRWLWLGAAALAAPAVAALLVRPGLERVAGTDGEQLLELAERLPSGVELTVSVQAGPGPMMLGAAAILVGIGAFGMRDV